MNVASFLATWSINENPFRDEEARHDAIFDRLGTESCLHPDFEKICGRFDHPSSSIVFGERGSGKTAIRLQILRRVEDHNRAHANQRCLPISYDELNPMLDRFSRQVRQTQPLEVVRQLTLVDHIDAILSIAVPRLVDQILDESLESEPLIEMKDPLSRVYRHEDQATRRELMQLQLCYDRPEIADDRTRKLRRAIGYRRMNWISTWKWGSGLLAVATMGVVLTFLISNPASSRALWWIAIIGLLLMTAGVAARFAWSWIGMDRLARDLARHLRVLNRSALSFRASLMRVAPQDALTANLPRSMGDDPRYAMLERLRRVLRPLGYRSVLVLVDRVDEPTLINGEPERMQALVWPMFNNKFLQQDGVAIKLLLPLELRDRLNRETAEFYRTARLDKQNFIERLQWSGATLYDLCSARLNACRQRDAEPMSLRDLFEDEVTRQDLVDALDQMQQPRDAFKFIYQVIQDHCSHIPEEQARQKIPRLVLDQARRQHVERLSGMLRGVRPG